jgi:hypothetical protein
MGITLLEVALVPCSWFGHSLQEELLPTAHMRGTRKTHGRHVHREMMYVGSVEDHVLNSECA